MLAGNRDYFVVDMIADTAIQTYISNCRSYLSAKKKILKQLALINADVFTINEDDGSGMLVTQDMIRCRTGCRIG